MGSHAASLPCGAMRPGRRSLSLVIAMVALAAWAAGATGIGTGAGLRALAGARTGATGSSGPTGPRGPRRPPSRAPQTERFTLHSAMLHRALGEIVVIPGGTAPPSPRPLLVLLHGRGASPAGWLSDEFFRGLAKLGPRAPDVLLANGGDHSYFHDRADGPWGSSVMQEAIPAALRRTGADPRRMAVGGISMGGFGAFDLARLHPGTFCAVGGHSAALWERFADSAPGAFDDSGDFARHDVIAAVRRHPTLYGRARIWLDGGNDDPFRSADEALAAAPRAPYGPVSVMHWPGGHDGSYWHAHVARYLAFYGNALAGGGCRRPGPAQPPTPRPRPRRAPPR